MKQIQVVSKDKRIFIHQSFNNKGHKDTRTRGTRNHLTKETEKESSLIVLSQVDSNAAMQVHYGERETEIKSIPGFWGMVFSKHDTLTDFITPKDREILKNLSTFKVKVDVNPQNEFNYSFEFGFDSNDYFETPSITKSYQPSSSAEVNPEIKWKKGMMPNGVAKGNKRNWKVYENISFFTWFCKNEDPEEKIHTTLKDFIWPKAWTIYKEGVAENELGISADIIQTMDSIQVGIDEAIKKQRLDIQRIQRDSRSSLASIYQKRDALTNDIDHFWLKVFLSHRYFNSRLNKNDIEIKKYLTSLEVKDDPIEAGDNVVAKHSNVFAFRKNNPLFADQRLKKTFSFDGELDLVEKLATKITVNIGMSLDEVPRHPESRGESKATERSTSIKSFYRWFSSTNELKHLIIEDEISDMIMMEIIRSPLKIIGESPYEVPIPVWTMDALNKRAADNTGEAGPSKRGRLNSGNVE